MGDKVNGLATNILGWVSTALTFVAAAAPVVTWIG